MTVYIDPDYRCHPAPAKGLRAVETDFFDGKCEPFIRGYRLVPDGEVWRRADGRLFPGPMICPAENGGRLSALQQFFESMAPELYELKEKLQRLHDCMDGLATVPSLEQLQDFMLMIREIMEED